MPENELAEITQLDLDELLLDEENPRLLESTARDQQSMLDYIAASTSIEELMGAIANNDYFAGEPIIVVPHETIEGKFVVVEGNRRLTALRLLQDPEACSNPGNKIREIANQAKYKPTRIPVVKKATRALVLPYLGFRHITGIKQWEPLAKARYIKQIFDLTDPANEPRDRYYEVAKVIGSRRDHIKRSLDALAVYRKIENENFYDIENLDEESIKFSILSTALADDRIGFFVGMSRKDGTGNFISNDPIVFPECLLNEPVSELTHWLYEKIKGKTKVGESRNLRMLAAVVSDEKALAAFRSDSPLKIAFEMTSDITQDFMALLYQADSLVTEAASMVATIDYSSEAQTVSKRIFENIRLIGREMVEKLRAAEDEF
ncbi:hypothetical protein MTYP_01901 [Methylophilaceae bacterium]|nr:hypothetical protein MTYP_01901 [Methylophilaceae bacterium]